jgi:hypothetical protein
MKNLCAAVIGLFFLFACGHKKNHPDTSSIEVNTSIQRFDKDYFAIDSNKLAEGINALNVKYPDFANDFTVNILGAGPINDTNKVLPQANKLFFQTYYPVYKETEKLFSDLGVEEKTIKQGFQNIKHYFPAYPLPQLISYIGPFDAPGVALTQNAVAIGLQLYAGKDFPFYTSTIGQELFPLYISRRFEKEYIPVNCMKAISEDLFPDNSQQLPLIEQMVEKGKYWYMLDILLPETADSLKTGYTENQLKWCEKNEGVIWGLLLQNDLLYSMDPGIIQIYIGEAPSTQGFPTASPGNIGQWIGLQITRAYIDKHAGISPAKLMNTSAKEIIEGAKYKPR